ncbi:MAG: hypothetical protein GTN36_00760 [Candidatus Aenigmarchaeota archaeon]|nr:hypothetical protein [Candidatus Aenigmarchaeota archaeon]
MFLFIIIVLLLIVLFLNTPEQIEAICIDCIPGHIGGGCTYTDKSGNIIQPSSCIPYDKNITKYICSDKSREVEACIEIYRPVCGNDAKTYSNSCFACMNKMVSFYLEGECPQVVDESYCNFDEDCACGIHKETSDCFYGNKAYVDTSQQCPDFCTGIAGNLIIKCVNNKCIQVSS